MPGYRPIGSGSYPKICETCIRCWIVARDFLSNFQGGGGGGHLRFWTFIDKF